MSSSVRARNELNFGNAIEAEREYQDDKWGWKHRTWPEWGIILGAEVGEVSDALKALRWDVTPKNVHALLDDLRSELIQVAAVCKAMDQQMSEIFPPAPSHEEAQP